MVHLAVLALDENYHLINLLEQLSLSYEVIEKENQPRSVPTHIIIIGKSIKKSSELLPGWIVHSNCKILAIDRGMQMVANTFGCQCNSLKKVQRGLGWTSEISAKKQVFRQRYFRRKTIITVVNEAFDINGVDSDNNIISFTDHRKWFAIQYHPEKYKYCDIELFKHFIYGHHKKKSHK